MTNPIRKVPNINIPMTAQDQAILLELRQMHENKDQRRYSISEIVKLALREFHKASKSTIPA